MSFVTSADGTRIAVETSGQGPRVVFVVGAFNDRGTGAELARALAPRFEVVRYDRRGRGDSGDRPPYAVEREIEDLAAVIGDRAASVLGFSSGAILALRAADAGVQIARLALYDLPLRVDGPPGPDHATRLQGLVEEGRRGDAVEWFQRELVGLPADRVEALRSAPFRQALEGMAHTLVYDARLVGHGLLPEAAGSAVQVPTLVAAGGAAPPFMARTAAVLAARLVSAKAAILEGATHDLVPEQLGPALVRFFGGPA
ncbi:MAG: alpha/beta fold hydrolase [Myxococcota bacterium]